MGTVEAIEAVDAGGDEIEQASGQGRIRGNWKISAFAGPGANGADGACRVAIDAIVSSAEKIAAFGA